MDINAALSDINRQNAAIQNIARDLQHQQIKTFAYIGAFFVGYVGAAVLTFRHFSK